MKKTLKMLTILSMLFSLESIASGCGELDIVIQNHTGSACVLQKSQVNSGYLISSVPQSIPPNQSSDTITLEQGLISGISSVHVYRCGSESIELRTNQGYCFMNAADVTGQIYSANSIHVRYIAQNGSWWSSYPGRMTWTIF